MAKGTHYGGLFAVNLSVMAFRGTTMRKKRLFHFPFWGFAFLVSLLAIPQVIKKSIFSYCAINWNKNS